MQALDEVRAAEIEMDMELSPVEECYGFLQRCGVAVAREEIERVDSLRYTFKNLQAQACSVQSHLVTIQQEFKTNLQESVQKFQGDLSSFLTQYQVVNSLNQKLVLVFELCGVVGAEWSYGSWSASTRSL